MKKSIDIIEQARSYYILSKDHVMTSTKPMFVGNRIKLEFVLQIIPEGMIIATSGNSKRCIILIDYTSEECWAMIQKGNRMIIKLKQLKAKN